MKKATFIKNQQFLPSRTDLLITGSRIRNLAGILLLLINCLTVSGQYISEILDYIPAPSQYMNAEPWGTPASAQSIVGGIQGSVSLGAFGGTIIFRFAQPVENDPENPFGVDFTIFGNPVPNWSEPGIVSVMKDENGNGLPDDTWYELAGSDYRFTSTVRDYAVTYSNPGGSVAEDVPWTDNLGNTGFIRANSFYSQPYYPLPDSFPSIDHSAYTLEGTMIRTSVDTAYANGIYSLRRAFGYADNQYRGSAPYTLPDNPYTPGVENSGGDAFDISWAVDETGKYIHLNHVDFIRVHTAVLDGAGWLGQISTEITGAIDVPPYPEVNGPMKKLVIRELPPVLHAAEYQLEVFAFENGRFRDQQEVRWTTTMESARVDEENILHAGSTGAVTITAELADDDQVTASVSTYIDLSTVSADRQSAPAGFTLYPNPAREHVWLRGQVNGVADVLDLSGKILISGMYAEENACIYTGDLDPGIYIVRLQTETGIYSSKLLIE